MPNEDLEQDLLETINSQGILTEKEASRILYYTLLRVKKIHEAGQIIGNLSPEAIILCKKGNRLGIKIDSKHQVSMSPLFVAPEILSKRNFTFASDLWSVGVICYVLLCGYPPFYDCSNNVLLKTIIEGKYEFHEPYWREHSEEARDFIQKLLMVNQTDRLSIHEALDHLFIQKYIHRQSMKPVVATKKLFGSLFSPMQAVKE